MTSLIQEAQQVLMHTYNPFPINLVSGDGCYVKDSNGREYLDFLSGIAVNSLGYNHPGFNEAVDNQLHRIIHYSNLFLNEQQIDLAKKLINNSSFDKAFFCNSGTEAVESALKLAKKFGKAKKNGAWKIIAMNQSFHGRTSGSLSLTGQIKYQHSFLPLLPGVVFARFNDFDDLKQKMDPDTCAVILEPIQGEGGIHPADKKYLEKVRDLCTVEKAALIFDEVQCGMGRTGTLFAHEHFGVYPDIIALAKGLGGGLPIGAILSTKEFDLFEPGDHAATFGGNPLVCSGARAVLHELIDNNLLETIRESGSYMKERLEQISQNYSFVKEIRGLGFMLGMEVNIPAADIVSSCREEGLLLVTAGPSVVRFVPPLITGKNEIDKAIHILNSVLEKLQKKACL